MLQLRESSHHATLALLCSHGPLDYLHMLWPGVPPTPELGKAEELTAGWAKSLGGLNLAHELYFAHL